MVITEIGGTTGDIESLPFLEAIRQISFEIGRENCLFMHVTLVPYIKSSGEHKSKPTQHSVKELLSIGIQPDIIVCRSEVPLERDLKAKIGLFCNVSTDCVIENLNADTIYDVPIMLEKQSLSDKVCERLGIDAPPPDLEEWKALVNRVKSLTKKVKIALVGKYVALHDAYLSVAESLRHAGFDCGAEVDIDWIDAEEVTPDTAEDLLKGADGILVPGGFGQRGIEGKIEAIRYARENKVPFFGICLGMQLAVVEFARNVAGLEGAHSSELDPDTPYPVIDIMPEQKDISDKGGTMRLGAYPCVLKEDTFSKAAYNTDNISERHRHRFEMNNAYRDKLADAGLVIAGTSPNNKLVEIVELKDHPWFVGVQFHPEFKTRPTSPHPLFKQFVEKSLDNSGK